ncbi:unnamed protein product [Rhodiola kirilowii]
MDTRLTKMEEQQTADMQQMCTAIERLSKVVEDNQRTTGKQPLFPNTAPSILGSPSQVISGDSNTSQHPADDPTQPKYGDNNPRPFRTPRIDVPIFTGEGVVGWLFQLNRYFTINNVSPDQMLDSAPLFVAGDALLWFQWKATTAQISSWDQLAMAIKRRFGPSDYYDAEVAINQLVQTASVHAYITEFERLSASAPRLLGHNLLSRFVAGLKEDIRHEIIILRPIDLDTAMGMARVADDKLQALRRLAPRPSFSRTPYRPPPTINPDHSKPTHTPLPIRRLTPTEITARRAKGLCFNCDERYVPGHNCRPKFQCLLMEEPCDGDGFELVEAEPTDPPEPIVPDETGQHTEATPCITFHALQGRAAPCTLRFQAHIQGQPVLVLVDSGSTHNFVQTRTARFLKLPIEPSNHLSVTVGNGEEMKCEGVCREVPVTINGTLFPIELHLLPVFGADLVLGA